jgi:hypothetical protein
VHIRPCLYQSLSTSMMSSSSTPKSGVGLRAFSGFCAVPCRRGGWGTRAPPAPYAAGPDLEPSVFPVAPQVGALGASCAAAPVAVEVEPNARPPDSVFPEDGG